MIEIWMINILSSLPSFFLQLHYEAWVRFVVLSIITIGIYAFYGQYHANPVSLDETIIYHMAPEEETH